MVWPGNLNLPMRALVVGIHMQDHIYHSMKKQQHWLQPAPFLRYNVCPPAAAVVESPIPSYYLSLTTRTRGLEILRRKAI
jgi:hypothetical protein